MKPSPEHPATVILVVVLMTSGLVVGLSAPALNGQTLLAMVLVLGGGWIHHRRIQAASRDAEHVEQNVNPPI